MPKHSRDSGVNEKVTKKKRSVSIGFVTAAVAIAFIAGNRFQFIGDWFFSPYSNNANSSLSRNLDYSSADDVYDLLKKKFDGKLKVNKLNDGLKKGLVDAAGDPYTVYMTADEAAEFDADLNGTFSGIGAELGKRDGGVVIIAPLSGSPAEAAGLRPNDRIISVDGEDATEYSIDEAVTKIRGDIGTKVKLEVVRSGEVKEIEVTRAQINVPSVESEILEGNIGYLKITRFSDDTADLAKKAAADFKAKNVSKVIVDIRNNGGGLLSSSVDIAGLWLDNKVVVQEKRGDKVISTLKTGDNPPLGGIPTVVLINGGSASASEILAGALSDHGVATLLGEKTFGKGSVQELIDLEDGGKLKVTVARWYTPNGNNIDKEGIKPDIEVKLTDEDYNKNRDPQKVRAIKELN
jgi:carboxyl-terminal processing protease